MMTDGDEEDKGPIWRLPVLKSKELGKLGPGFGLGAGCGFGLGFGLIGGERDPLSSCEFNDSNQFHKYII